MNKCIFLLLMLWSLSSTACSGLLLRARERFLEENHIQEIFFASEQESFHYLTNYREGEEKPHLVFVHGITGSRYSFLRWVQFLMDKYTLWIPDLLGSGNNPKNTTQSLSLHKQAAYLREFVSHIGIQEFVLVGVSMGGGVAAAYALEWGESVEKLVLLTPIGERAPRTSLLYRQLLRTLFHQTDFLLHSAREANVRRLQYMVAHKPVFIFYPVMKDYIRSVTPFYDHYYQMGLSIYLYDGLFPLAGRYQELTMPVMFVLAAQDKVFDISTLEVFRQQLPNARYEVIPDVGHALEVSLGGLVPHPKMVEVVSSFLQLEQQH